MVKKTEGYLFDGEAYTREELIAQLIDENPNVEVKDAWECEECQNKFFSKKEALACPHIPNED